MVPIENINHNVHMSLVRHYDSEDACDEYLNSDSDDNYNMENIEVRGIVK